MKIAANEATKNRPAGSRMIDAPYVFLSIPDAISKLKEEPAWQKNDRNSITTFKTEGITSVLSALHTGATIDDNQANGVLMVHVLEGKIKAVINDTIIEATEKQFITFHRSIHHSISALEDSIVLMTITGE